MSCQYVLPIHCVPVLVHACTVAYCKICSTSISVNPNRDRGEGRIPPTFRAIILWIFFFPHRKLLWLFFFQVWCNYFCKNWAIKFWRLLLCKTVMECQLKIWTFSGIVYKTYGKWLFMPKIHFELKMHYLLALQLKLLFIFLDIQYF